MGTAPETATPRFLSWAIGVAILVMLLGLGGGAASLTRADYVGAGACLLAAGVTAALLANAALRR